MTLVELKYLVALAEELHFGKAAERCFVSQPTLSVAINKLEQSLCVDIFERQKSGIRITAAGEKLIAQARRVLEEAGRLKEMAQCANNELSSPLRVGAIHTVAPYLFPALIPKLNKIAPDMPLIIHEGLTSDLRVKLQQGELDVIFIALPFTETAVVVRTLYEEPFRVLMPKNHPLAAKESISSKDLAKEKLLLLGQGHCFRDQILKACPQCGDEAGLLQTVEGTSLETLRSMVASGMGVTILPSTATQVRHYSQSMCVRPFKEAAPRRKIALAWRHSFPRGQAVDALLQALKLATLCDTCPID